MKPTNVKLLKGLSAAMLCMGSSLVMAETVTIPATVTVNNAIDFTSTGTLNFGEVRAAADTAAAGNCSGLTLPTNSLVPVAASGAAFTTVCSGTGAAVIQAVGGTPSRPTLTIAGVAPFTTLDVVLPTTADLTAATGPGNAQFRVINFTAFKTSAPTATVTTTIQTDGTGGAVFTVGGTLITDPTDPVDPAYQDLAYSGSFDVEVTY